MEEIFDVYSRDGKYIGKKEKSICHSKNPNFYHKPVWIWIVNDKNEILVQRRAECKKTDPNLWDMPVAGHVTSGEDIIDGAIRETYEELGIETKKEEYKFLFEYIFDECFELAQVFLLNKNIEIDNLNLDKNEVKEVKWFSYEEFKRLFYSDDFAYVSNDYKEKVLDILKEVNHE